MMNDKQPPINSQQFMTTNCTCGRLVEVKKIEDPKYQFEFKCKCGNEVKLQLPLQGS